MAYSCSACMKDIRDDERAFAIYRGVAGEPWEFSGLIYHAACADFVPDCEREAAELPASPASTEAASADAIKNEPDGGGGR